MYIYWIYISFELICFQPSKQENIMSKKEDMPEKEDIEMTEEVWYQIYRLTNDPRLIRDQCDNLLETL